MQAQAPSSSSWCCCLRCRHLVRTSSSFEQRCCCCYARAPLGFGWDGVVVCLLLRSRANAHAPRASTRRAREEAIQAARERRHARARARARTRQARYVNVSREVPCRKTARAQVHGGERAWKCTRPAGGTSLRAAHARLAFLRFIPVFVRAPPSRRGPLRIVGRPAAPARTSARLREEDEAIATRPCGACAGDKEEE